MVAAKSTRSNARGRLIILGPAILAAALYLSLGLLGDLTSRLELFFPVFALLLGLMALGWQLVRRDAGRLRLALLAALAFRLLAAAGDPALSDDVYRYVWDGRVQVEGVHPYRYAPAAPELAPFRDDDWTRINHVELRTIYPPLAEGWFFVLAALGAGPLGFKLAMGCLDFAVVLALGWLLKRLSLPGHRVMLYAWNPLAIMESAGSGHVEPLGVLLLVLAVGWIIERKHALSTTALAAAIHVKLLPLMLVPGMLRRLRTRYAALLLLVLVALALPYALNGPAVGSGLFDYAERWERNALVFSGVRGLMEQLDSGEQLKPVVAALHHRIGDHGLPWGWIESQVWPDRLARLIVGLLALLWIGRCTFHPRLGVPRETFLVLGGVLLLSPTMHPWYVLWILPFAAAHLAWGWLAFAALVPLAYLGAGGDVPWLVRSVEYGLPLLVLLATARLRRNDDVRRLS